MHRRSQLSLMLFLMIVFVSIGMFPPSLYADGTPGRYEIVAYQLPHPYGSGATATMATEANRAAFIYFGRFTVNVTGSRPSTYPPIPIEVDCLGTFCDPHYLALSPNGAFAVSGTKHYSEECGTRECWYVIHGWTLSLYDGGTEISREIDFDTSASFDNPSISNDGNWTTFDTTNSTLASNDTNNTNDVFVYALETDTYTLVSRNITGSSANGSSTAPSMSADGQHIVFTSLANNLVSGDTNGAADIFLFNRDTNTVTRLSANANGEEGNAPSTNGYIEAGGRYVVFVSESSNLVANDTNGVADIFRYNVVTGAIERVSLANDGGEGNGAATDAMISEDGNKIAFASVASNLVTEDTNGKQDIFLRDLSTATTRRISVWSNGNQGTEDSIDPAISADGRTILFNTSSKLQPSDTNGLFDSYAYDWLQRTYRVTETTPKPWEFAAANDTGLSGNSVTANGDAIVYRRLYAPPSHTIYDRLTKRHTPFASYLPESVPSISADGRYMVGSEGRVAYRYDRSTNEREIVSITPDGESTTALYVMIAGNGNMVAFKKSDTNAQPIYLRNMATSTSTLVSHLPDSDDIPMPQPTVLVDLSADGQFVLFNVSYNQQDGVRLYSLVSDDHDSVALANDGQSANADAYGTSVSGDGRYVTFVTKSTNITNDDENGAGQDLFLRDRSSNTTTLLSKDYAGSNMGGETRNGVISDNGRYVAIATTLPMVAEDTNDIFDVYLLDLQTDSVVQISPEGGIADADMSQIELALSNDGNVVVFRAQLRYMFDDVPQNFNDSSLFAYDRSAPALKFRAFAPLMGR